MLRKEGGKAREALPEPCRTNGTRSFQPLDTGKGAGVDKMEDYCDSHRGNADGRSIGILVGHRAMVFVSVHALVTTCARIVLWGRLLL